MTIEGLESKFEFPKSELNSNKEEKKRQMEESPSHEGEERNMKKI